MCSGNKYSLYCRFNRLFCEDQQGRKTTRSCERRISREVPFNCRGKPRIGEWEQHQVIIVNFVIVDSLTFFNYLSHVLKKEYPSEMTVSEFVEVMIDILQAGGIDHIEYDVFSSPMNFIVVSSRAIVPEAPSRALSCVRDDLRGW